MSEVSTLTVEQEHTDMVKRLSKSGVDILASLTPSRVELLHHALGLATEVFEVQEFFTYGSHEPDNMLEECGDTAFYFRGAVVATGVTEQEITEADLIAVPEGGTLLDEYTYVAAQLIDAIKRVTIYENPMDHPKVMMASKIASYSKAYAALVTSLPITQEDALRHNLNKLDGANGRYKGGSYSNEAATARNDKA